MHNQTTKAPLTARALALQILLKTHQSGSYANLSLSSALEKSGLSPVDGALCTRLVYGVLEKQITLDYLISQLSTKPIQELDPDLLEALRIGLYQIRYMDKIPSHAAVNETVDLVFKRQRGFVNAVLRQYLREEATLTLPNPLETHDVLNLSIATSVPLPLAQLMADTFGFEEAYQLLSYENPNLLTLRVNTLKVTREELLAQLTARHPEFHFELTPHSPVGILCSGGNPASFYGFDQGLFFVQDESSQICTCVADAQPNMTVIDTCACPGSKSFGLAISMDDQGQVMSFDLHANKLSLITSGAARLGLTCIEAAAHDGRVAQPNLQNTADVVLCDVPCSGFGIIFKKPEIRNKDPQTCERLPQVQSAILEASSSYVKDGGTLIYSTCTLLPRENEQVVHSFLIAHPEFVLQPFSVGDIRSDGFMTLLPHVHHTDGFFIAKLKKQEALCKNR